VLPVLAVLLVAVLVRLHLTLLLATVLLVILLLANFIKTGCNHKTTASFSHYAFVCQLI
jgi:hypothetical protein